MPILGAHMSMSGGFHLAVQRAAEAGCDCVQIFTKNNNQWAAKDIHPESIGAFRDALAQYGITHPLSHSSYLINIAAVDDALWQKSVDALAVEIRRAAQLGIPYVVLHPGAHTTQSESEGVQRAIQGLVEALEATDGDDAAVLLESTAGQGTCLGHRFEHLAAMLDGVACPDRMGVCLDTCHLHAAGYDLTTKAKFDDVIDEFDRLIGLSTLKAIHLNDSKRELGSRVDRHENIGHGEIGDAPFRFLMTDPRFAHVPMYLETPKGEDDAGRCWDQVNLARLRGMATGRRIAKKK